jgi:hypothetical protein
MLLEVRQIWTGLGRKTEDAGAGAIIMDPS